LIIIADAPVLSISFRDIQCMLAEQAALLHN